MIFLYQINSEEALSTNTNDIDSDKTIFLEDFTRDMYLIKHKKEKKIPHFRTTTKRNQIGEQSLISTTIKELEEKSGRPIAPEMPHRPLAPNNPSNPSKPLITEDIVGHHLPMMADGLEAYFYRVEKRAMEGQFVPSYYDPNGAQDGSGRGFDDPLGQLPSETNLCFALLENWLRSCAEPQIMLEVSVTTKDFDEQINEKEKENLEKEEIMNENNINNNDNQLLSQKNDIDFLISSLPLQLIPNTTEAFQDWNKDEINVKLKNEILEDPEFLPVLLSNNDTLKMFIECYQHPLMIPYYLSQDIGKSALKFIAIKYKNSPKLQNIVKTQHLLSSRPMAPEGLSGILSALNAVVMIVGVVSTVFGSIAAMLSGAGEGVEKALPILSGFTDTLWQSFRADKGPPGIRAGFVQPELYDPRGPYGPEPFPFQTPGAEKCHRFLVSYVHKCAVN